MFDNGGESRGPQGHGDVVGIGNRPAYLDSKGAARYLNVTERVVNDMRRQRKLTCYRLGNKTIRYLAADMDRDIRKLKINAVGE